MKETEITPEPIKEPIKQKPNRALIREKTCCICDTKIGNREFEVSGHDVICGDCCYEIGGE